jgi:hypothetical protein
MAGLDPAIPLRMARPCLTIGIAGSSPAMTAEKIHRIRTCSTGRASTAGGYWDRDRCRGNSRVARSNCSRSARRTNTGRYRDHVPAAGRCRSRNPRTRRDPLRPRELPPKAWRRRQQRLPTASTSSSSSPITASRTAFAPNTCGCGKGVPATRRGFASAKSLAAMWGIDGGSAHTDLRRFDRSCLIRGLRGPQSGRREPAPPHFASNPSACSRAPLSTTFSRSIGLARLPSPTSCFCMKSSLSSGIGNSVAIDFVLTASSNT